MFLLRSRLAWWVNPLMVASIIIVVGAVVDLTTGKEVFFTLFFAKKGGMLLGLMIGLPILAIVRLWQMRRVSVFSDRVEIRHPLHPSWNCTIDMAEVDGVYEEPYVYKMKNGELLYYRLYLLTGRQLWLYVDSQHCANYDEMQSVMTEFFGLSRHGQRINLGVLDLDHLKKGQPITVNQITLDEINELRRLHDSRLRFENSGWIRTEPLSFEVVGWRNLLVVAGLAAVILFGIKMHLFYQKSITANLAVVDRETEIPDKPFVIVDSIDADTINEPYKTMLEVKKNRQGDTLQKNRINYWAFPVRGRQEWWVAFTLRTGYRHETPYLEQRRYLLDILHNRQRYSVIQSGTLNDGIQVEISRRIPFTPTPERIGILQYASEEPLMLGNPLYQEALTLLERGQYQKAIPLLEVGARHGSPSCANELSYVYAREERYDDALRTIDEALKMCPDEANFYDSKGEILLMSGDTAGARQMWDKVLTLDPHFPEHRNSQLYKKLIEPETKPKTLYMQSRRKR